MLIPKKMSKNNCMSIKPLGDRVLVRPKKEEEITVSGIVLPDTVDKENKAEGEIVAVGNGPAIAELGELQRQSQWRLDFVAAENSMGFHAPQEMARILAESIDLSRQAETKAAALRART